MWHACVCREIPKYFWWKNEGKRQLGKAMFRWEFAVQMDLKKQHGLVKRDKSES
jgi:hypothetical protein